MQEASLEIGGGVVFWTLSEWTSRNLLVQHFDRLGLLQFVPEQLATPTALREALEQTLGGARILIRPLAKRDGFAVVREERGSTGNHYVSEMTARVGEGNHPVLYFEPNDDRSRLVEQAFYQQLGRISNGQLSSALVNVVENLDGTRLRPSGAIYWIPGPRLDDWGRIADAVERSADSGKSSLYLLRHRLDQEAIRAVRDAVVGEVKGEVKRIQGEIVSGELGSRALQARKQQAHDLRDKVNVYEDLLQVGLQGLHQILDDADQAVATASLLIGASQELATVEG
jgi:hypothetical protein